MRTIFLLICYLFSAATVHAAQTCKPESIPASTPDSQLVDNGDGTITDLGTGLMWKKCPEGVSGNLCDTDTDSRYTFTWQEALRQPGVVNNAGGFAGYTDWRLPNIKELISIVEEQCDDPAINLNRFPNTPTIPTMPHLVWSGSPYAGNWEGVAWLVSFHGGYTFVDRRVYHYAVRLVRGGQ